MGQRLRQKATRFDLIVSSHALRARQTAQLIAGAIDYPADQIRIEQNLYLASSSEILAVARSLPNQHSRIVLVGHNNGITDLANVFSPEYIANVPTCGILTMRFDMEEWNHLDPAFLDSFSFE